MGAEKKPSTHKSTASCLWGVLQPRAQQKRHRHTGRRLAAYRSFSRNTGITRWTLITFARWTLITFARWTLITFARWTLRPTAFAVVGRNRSFLLTTPYQSREGTRRQLHYSPRSNHSWTIRLTIIKRIVIAVNIIIKKHFLSSCIVL